MDILPIFLFIQTLYTLHLADGLVTQIPLPKNLYDCLDQKSDNTSTIPSRTIQSFCISNFVETTATWSTNITDPNVRNYITSLLRGVVREAELDDPSRQKRQVFGGPVRREVRAAPYQYNWRQYALAVRRLKNSFSVRQDTNNYDVIAGIHSGSTLGPAHQGPNFLGWHRIYLLILEQALGTTIPYWDSSLDFAMDDPVNTILFTARYFGNGFGFITNGPFANLPGRPILRNIGSDGTLISKQAIASVLSRTRHAEIVEPSTAGTVQYSLEAHHNGPHVWVDGTLASLASAAYDPIFFCHHAFIDYIWEQFRRRIPNAEADYPPTNVAGHEPFRFMNFGEFPFAPRVRTSEAYSARYARLRSYQPAPSCPRCADSPDLVCNTDTGICESRVAPPQMRMQAPAARGAAGAASIAGFTAQVVSAPDEVEADTPERAQNAVAQTGPLAAGPKFVSPFRDGRTRGGSIPVAPADPSLIRGKRSVVGEINKNQLNSVKTNQQTVHSVNNFVGQNKREMPYQNSFIINGKSDINQWVFMPVKVVYMQSSGASIDPIKSLNLHIDHDTHMSNSTVYKSLEKIPNKPNPAVYDRCSHITAGPDRVFVESDGINYSGRYKDYAKIDPFRPVSSSFTYIGIKKPSNESSIEALITAYDTCGRVCKAKCLVFGSRPPVYKSCAGSIMADTRFPLMYGRTYNEAMRDLWILWESTSRGINNRNIPVMFVCDRDTSLPWYHV
ncbi:Hypothetical predicted protein [Mytilus galloprovincialis]|uniref:Tyrosinase copper-binding domain-containing protein n=1 Tax=Mytilus galloprovincialis TaxID=29158 RepID=A0A8B6BS83_MYTGA|nr:Hypothetical predicted protein [Mytilus galloprovincialis]